MLQVPHGLEQTYQLLANGFTACLELLSRDGVRTGNFPTAGSFA